jgi:molybdopterin converting factor small subunit
VQLFASYAELFGVRTVELPLRPGSTVQELIEKIRSLPGGATLPSAPRIALNRAFASSHQVVAPTDEIALIPPVAGG